MPDEERAASVALYHSGTLRAPALVRIWGGGLRGGGWVRDEGRRKAGAAAV
jgi:hypothetical protein